jgi:three-Cys-motif partner protein
MTAQKFGGPWSLVKVEAVERYLSAFSLALSRQNFRRVYIDAFAGSGHFTFGDQAELPLLAETDAQRVYSGSALRALNTQPLFHNLFFIEQDAENIRALKELQSQDDRVEVCPGDANAELRKLFSTVDWSNTRGVLFLDPFGNSVEWTTLMEISRTKLDIWYLFPLSGIFRNAPLDHRSLTPDKHSSITKVLGTTNWETEFYRPLTQVQANLFSAEPLPSRRTANVTQIESFVKQRLETLFPYVLPPKRLLNPRKAPLFSLFFAMANPSKTAQKVASPIARHILQSL